MPARSCGVLAAFIAALFVLAGCAAATPESPAAEADAAACTSQADAVYNNENVDVLSRTSQNGLYFGNTPTHAFDAQRTGSLHQRDSAITDCEEKGNSDQRSVLTLTPVAPHIIDSN